MNTQALLSLLHLSSPSLPIGAFAYSQGLETAVDLEWVTDENSLQGWLQPQLLHALVQLEVPLLQRCYQAWQQQDYAAIARWQAIFLANRDSAELLKEEQQLGTTLRRLLVNLGCELPTEAKAFTYLPLYAYALTHFDIELQAGISGWLWSWLENQITVACKTIPLGQTPAQQTLIALMPSIEASVRHGLSVPDDQIGMKLNIQDFSGAKMTTQCLRVGVGGPVGSGKTALLKQLCSVLRNHYDLAVVTNDIYTKEDASMNLAAIDELQERHPKLELVLVESGGDNLSATFSPELSDLTLYVIDVCAGDKIPRKGGPGITKSDLLIINKTDIAPMVNASLEVMDRDAKKMRGEKPFVFTNFMRGDGIATIIDFIVEQGMLAKRNYSVTVTPAAL